MPQSPTDDLALGTRTGLPDDLLRLRKMYPRDVWAEHANLGEWVRFWLERHDMFRQVGAIMEDACQQLCEGRIDTAEFMPWFSPRLEFYLGHLDLHHRIEEAHIFPAFARAEPALRRGFDLLEADHQAIHGAVEAMQSAMETLAAGNGAAGTGHDTQTRLAALCHIVNAHLDDEENLIVPIVLDRGEAAIGLF